MSLYRLANGVTFSENTPGQGGILSLRYPQRLLKLSGSGIKGIKALCQTEDPEPLLDEKLLEFAGQMEDQGIIERCFLPLSEEQLPTVSIIVPTYKRQKMLNSCLQSLLELDYPKEKLEIIVVDDASPEPVTLAGHHSSIRLIRLARNGGPGVARNEAVRQANGEILAFLDDDCLADSLWLKTLVRCFQFNDVAAAGGRVESADLTRPLEKYEQVQSPLLMGANQRKVRKASALSYLATCNLLVRKSAFSAISGFEPSMRVGEDVDLCWRLLSNSGKIYYIPGGLVFHHHRSELIPFLKRRLNYGQSEAKLQARYPNERRRMPFFPGNNLIPPVLVVAVLLRGWVFGLVAGCLLLAVNLLWQSLRKWLKIRTGNYEIGLWGVLRAAARSQGTACYLYSQHFSRYYSIPVFLLSLLVLPHLTPLAVVIHLLPSIVDYRLKRPDLSLGYFVFYHSWEDTFYQAGVLSGCLNEKNWRPLSMDFVKADDKLLQRLALKN